MLSSGAVKASVAGVVIVVASAAIAVEVVVGAAVVVAETAFPPFCPQPESSIAQAKNIEVAVFLFIVLLPFLNFFSVSCFHKYKRKDVFLDEFLELEDIMTMQEYS